MVPSGSDAPDATGNDGEATAKSSRGAARAPGPVTHDELRNIRRWILVAGVWAVAAAAIALIALLDTSNSDAERAAGDARAGVTATRKAQDALDGRLDRLESRLSETPRTRDVNSLESRLARVETDATKANGRSKTAAKSLTNLENRVDDLEREVAAVRATPPGDSSAGRRPQAESQP